MGYGHPVIEWNEKPDRNWWALIRSTPAACWWRLLLVPVLLAPVGLAVHTVCAGLTDSGLSAAADTVRLAAGGLLAAWGWSAKLRILDGDRGILSALLPDLRRIGRLGGWLVVLDLLGLLELLIHVDSEAYVEVAFSPAIAVIALIALYLAFATALLPMAVVLEGQGVRRSWKLSHGNWRTVVRVLPVVVLGWVATEAIGAWSFMALAGYPAPQRSLLIPAVAFLPQVLLSTLTAVLLYAAYRSAAPGSSRAGHGRREVPDAAAVTAATATAVS